MRFDCGESWEELVARRKEWHPFFTILPRRVDSHDCRWFEWIERRGRLDPYGWLWIYRAKSKPEGA